MSQRPVLPAVGQQMMPGLQTPVNKTEVEPFHHVVSVSDQRLPGLVGEEGLCWYRR